MNIAQEAQEKINGNDDRLPAVRIPSAMKEALNDLYAERLKEVNPIEGGYSFSSFIRDILLEYITNQ